MTGGLPALSGLTVTQNPMARELQSYGRGDDSMLVHMTPAEVNSLQGLAMATGGSLTINPHTGLPEAGWLGKLLPTILGFAGAAFGLPTWAIGLGGAAAGTAATGSLSQGLMMGLQAFGGASLAGGLGVGEAGKAVEAAAGASGAGSAGGATTTAMPEAASEAFKTAFGNIATPSSAASAVAPGAVDIAKAPGFFDKFSQAAKAGMPGGVLSKAAPYAAGLGLLNTVSEVTAPNLPKYEEEDGGWDYKGPYLPAKREVKFQTPEQMRESGGAEFEYFTPSNPVPGYVPSTMLTEKEKKEYGFADGGLASLPPQGFNNLVSYFGAGDPGAITASMYPTTPTPTPSAPTTTGPTTGGETLYNFGAQPTNVPPPPTNMDFGYLNIPGIGNVQIPDFSGYDWSNIDWDAIAQQQGYIPESRAIQLDMPVTDLSGIYDRLNQFDSQLQSLPSQMPVYQEPDLSGIYDRLNQFDSQLQSLPSQLPVYQEPDFSGIYNRLNEFDSRLENLPLTYDFNDEFSGLYDRLNQFDSRLQQLPTELPIYQEPDFSGIYDRLNQFDSRLQQMPPYQAPDFSGIYNRLNELDSRLESPPLTYNFNDEFSGLYDRFGQLESRFNSMPTYETPDLSGIYDRFGQLESRFNSMPTYETPDLSGIYDRFGQLESRFNSMPTYETPDLSGIYDRFGQLESQFNSMPTYQAPDLSGIYSQLDQLRSMLSQNNTFSSPDTYDMNNDQYQFDTVGGFADGGAVDMRDGAFVVDARTVSELGNGSSNAGIEMLSRMGGTPVRGPGDGVSDSVPAKIGGKQEARVARDEVVFQPEAVRRLGGGSEKRGTQKLYAMMDRAHKARKKAKRGQDTKLRRGLA
jgi:hypothetical protein